MAQINEEAVVAKLSELTGAPKDQIKAELDKNNGDIDLTALNIMTMTVSEPVDASEAAEVAFMAKEAGMGAFA